jgi:hypothetical protein
MARRMARAMTAGVASAMMARATADRVRMALRGADRVDRETVVPMVVVPAVRMVLVVVDVVPMVAAQVVRMVHAAEVVVRDVVLAAEDLVVLEEVRAEGVSSNVWIRLTASSTKSCGRLSP